MKTEDKIDKLYGDWLYNTYGENITRTAHNQALEMSRTGFLGGYYLAKKLEKNNDNGR